MDADSLIQTMQQRLALSPKLGYRVVFDLDGEGAILLDGTEAPPVISKLDGSGADSGEEEADATLTLSPENLARMVAGQLDPTLAYMTGKLKVEGSMGVALKLASYLED
jgi:putative sterol carrier protein